MGDQGKRTRPRPWKVHANITLDPEILERCHLEASMQERSLSNYINMILRKALQDPEKGETT